MSNSSIQEGLNELWELLRYPTEQQGSALEAWCSRLEKFWLEHYQNAKSASDEDAGESKTAEDELERLEWVSSQLLRLLLLALVDDCQGIASEIDQAAIESILEQHSINSKRNPKQLQSVLRTSKNFLRWFLQIYPTTSRHPQQPKDKDRNVIPEWKSLPMLRLYLQLLEQEQNQQSPNPDISQHAAQILFYSSYNPVSGSDDALLGSYQILLEEDELMLKLLKALVFSTSTSVTLSIVRNVHNTLVSFPKAMEHCLRAELELTPDSPWSASLSSTTAGFSTILPLIALQSLEQPTFPEGKSGELVAEVTRAAYVLRLGSQLQTDNSPIGRLIVQLLRLQQNDECRRECVPLLMDANPAMVGEFLLQHDVVEPLLDILDAQVTSVVRQTWVSDAAAAALTPILVVWHRGCSHSTTLRNRVHESVFPSNDGEFARAKQAELNQYGKCRNMSPLVPSPPDTLRYRLLKLMTWPQSHIKRFTGELLWVVCENDATEFIARVGMGNAVTILGARGLVQIPGS